MAGDWIKFELATLDKPEVCQLADLANIDMDAVVGKLLRVWGWFDQHTESGNAPSVSKRLLDRMVGVTNFCEHMKSVGWMFEDEGLISLPRFERHNGKTAKNRLLTAKRVANHKAANAKGNGEGNAPSVSGALPKEDVEKSKSKEQDPPLPPKGEAGPQPEPKPAAAPAIAKPAKADAMEGFAEFWMRYPKKKSKVDAEKAWAKLKPNAELRAEILAALGQQVRSHDWTKNAGQFIPLPATWLNGRRWQDESAPDLLDNHHGFTGQRNYTAGLEANGDGSYRF
ncbi:hypothetical protein [Pseudomonas sp. BN415]|uniref:hypothetical protein n=1 Tax=Pseudomonas sp. BN415 TaxID=2567889 RepID=UPI002454798F|nr:hypothetical protein [Pseudomonas sp. BN415]